MLDTGNEKIEFRKLDEHKTCFIERNVHLGLVYFALDGSHHVEVISCSPGVYQFTPRRRKDLRKTDGKPYYFELCLLEHHRPKHVNSSRWKR